MTRQNRGHSPRRRPADEPRDASSAAAKAAGLIPGTQQCATEKHQQGTPGLQKQTTVLFHSPISTCRLLPHSLQPLCQATGPDKHRVGSCQQRRTVHRSSVPSDFKPSTVYCLPCAARLLPFRLGLPHPLPCRVSALRLAPMARKRDRSREHGAGSRELGSVLAARLLDTARDESHPRIPRIARLVAGIR